MLIMNQRPNKRAFSLVELVIVVVIIGIIAAIAVPRISRGARGAGDSSLRGSLAAMRNAIDMYAAEHNGAFPTVVQLTAGNLTARTDDAGTIGTTAGVHIFGPYLRVIPGLPVAGDAGLTGGGVGDDGVAAADAAGIGWLYTVATGAIVANTGTAADEQGTAYNTY